MMLALAAGLVNRFPSDAHDARSPLPDWSIVSLLMPMMLAPRCRVGQEVSVLMLMMLAPAAG